MAPTTIPTTAQEAAVIDLTDPTLTDGSAIVARFSVEITGVMGRTTYRVMDWDTGMVASLESGAPAYFPTRRHAEDWVRINGAA